MGALEDLEEASTVKLEAALSRDLETELASLKDVLSDLADDIASAWR